MRVDECTRGVSKIVTLSAAEYNTGSRSSLQAAQTSIRQGDIELAFQFLLKSTVEALKAVAVARDLKLRSDASVWDFGEALASDWRNQGIFSSAFPVARFAFLDSFGGYSFTFEELQAYHDYIAAGIKELQTLAAGETSQ